MNTQDIINILRQLDSQSIQSSITPWQQAQISRVQKVPTGVTLTPTESELKQHARFLSVVKKDGDIEKSEYFCFVPASSKKWKVFLLDKFYKILALLEDYDGEIKDNTTPYTSAFLLEMY